MEHLAQLFPEHDPDVLQLHLEAASGVLEAAIDSLLFVPTNKSKLPTAQRYAGNSFHEDNFAPQHKRQRRKSVEFISASNGSGNHQVLDLTLDSSDDDEPDDDFLEIHNQQPIQNDRKLGEPTGSLPNFDDFHREQQRIHDDNARKAVEIEEQKLLLISNFIAIARDMFEHISESYLVKLLEETRAKISSDNELIDTCIEAIFALNGQYPKAKSERKRPRQDEREDSDSDEGSDLDGEELSWGAENSNASGSSSQSKRDYMEYDVKMRDIYETQCATQMYQDFPMLTAASIRSCLKKFNFHYAPAFEYLNSAWADNGTDPNGMKLAVMNKPRTKKPPTDPSKLDPEFRKELQWVKAKVEKELKELQLAEDEEANLQYYTDRNELIECGCCYNERGAEAELGYRRTILKCMTAGCTSTFSDSEAIKFLPKSVFRGLLRARQQQELKMAGLESLVECPFCSYAAVVENDTDREFRCQAPKCLKVSCRLCKAPTHIPLSCEEYQKELEQNNVLSAQHRVEEKMSQALIRECPKCKARFYKTEVCRLWENTIERNENEVKEAAKKTLLELQADKPELAAKVRLDIPK
ncbi:hypothetical protein BGZ49_002296 [Haplosporangium sp. Z 27]|nr:hypothetical protein BGZ49_002296 [Haplosporangium sp. Z 27]